MATEVLAQSPAGPIEKVPDLKRRQRMVYWRQVDGVWMQTLLLPSDPVSRDSYLAKGFRLKPPNDVQEQSEPERDPEKERLYAEIAQLRLEAEERKEKKTRRARNSE